MTDDKAPLYLSLAAAALLGTALSVYFDDPYGHHLEVTTYEADEVRRSTH